MTNIIRAAQFAEQAHRGQCRKYSDAPYITHPGRVAARMSRHPAATECTVIAAWLHDVVEDCEVSAEDVAREFGQEVAGLVVELTNPSKGSKASRAERKAMDLAHLREVSVEARRLKLIDRTDNLREMSLAPGGFRRLYPARVGEPSTRPWWVPMRNWKQNSSPRSYGSRRWSNRHSPNV